MNISFIHSVVHDHFMELRSAALIGLESPYPKVVDAATILLRVHKFWPDDRIVIVKHDGKIVGFSVFNILRGDLHLLEIGSLTTTPGVGTALINEMINTARNEGAQRILLNPGSAVEFYRKMGFAVIGRNLMEMVV